MRISEKQVMKLANATCQLMMEQKKVMIAIGVAMERIEHGNLVSIELNIENGRSEVKRLTEDNYERFVHQFKRQDKDEVK